MTKTKKQLRAEAVERLKNCVAARFDAESIVIALTSGRHGQSDWSLECDKLIYLLTDDDANDDSTSEKVVSGSEPCVTPESCRQYADQRKQGDDADCESCDSREQLEADVRDICWGRNIYRFDAQKLYLKEHGLDVREDIVTTNYEGHVLVNVIMHLLDRQATITANEVARERYDMERDLIVERDEFKAEIAKYEHDCGLLFDEKHKLTAELDKLKELNGYHAVQYELASEDCDRLQVQVDRLTAELERATNNLNSANEDFENARAELTAERDYWKEQFMHCLTVAIRQERGDVLDRLMSYPRPADLIEPYQLVTDEVYTLRDFLAESEKERELYRKKQDERDELQAQVDELTNAGRKMSTELANMQDYITKVRAGRERYRSMCSEMATKIHDALMVMDEGMA